MSDRAEKLAEKWVTVEQDAHISGTWYVMLGDVLAGEHLREALAKEAALLLIARLAALLRQALVEEVQARLTGALGDGPGERPVSEEREKEVRNWLSPPSRTPDYIDDLIALLDHERQRSAWLESRLLHLLNDSEAYQHGLEVGQRQGREAEREACALLADAFEVYADGRDMASAIARAIRQRGGKAP